MSESTHTNSKPHPYAVLCQICDDLQAIRNKLSATHQVPTPADLDLMRLAMNNVHGRLESAVAELRPKLERIATMDARPSAEAGD
jgi:hypothetical protein